MDLKQVKEELVKAGVEIYRTRPPAELQVAERVRLHLMDSGIRVRLDESLTVVFTARTQQSDFPGVPPEHLFERVRHAVGARASERGFSELAAQSVDARDPLNEERVLDTLHEVTYAKVADGLDAARDEVLWALSFEKYVQP